MDFMKGLLDGLLEAVVKVFPLSPFTEPIAELGKLPFLGYLNWFVPVGDLLKITALWLVAIGLYYLYSVIARWVKLIR